LKFLFFSFFAFQGPVPLNVIQEKTPSGSGLRESAQDIPGSTAALQKSNFKNETSKIELCQL